MKPVDLRASNLRSPSLAGGGHTLSSGGPTTEPEAISRHLRFLVDHLGPRPVGSEEAARARRYLHDVIRTLGFSAEVQAFSTRVRFAGQASLLRGDGRSIPCQPAIGSPSTHDVLRGVPQLIALREEGLRGSALPPGTLALAPVRFDDERLAVATAAQRGAAAVLLFRERAPDLYSAVIPDGAAPVPCVTIRPADAFQLAQEAREVALRVETERRAILGENLMVELGEGGRPLLLLANYDSRPGTPGAYRNASGVVSLLMLLTRLRGWQGHQILLGFLDGEEPAAAGSRHCRDVLQATTLLPRLRGVVYVSGLGLAGLTVLRGHCPKPSNLADLVQQFAAEEGLLSTVDPSPSAAAPIPARLWRCPTLVLTGPPLPLQHTMLDRPDLLNPRLLSRTVSVLERLTRMTWRSSTVGHHERRVTGQIEGG